MLRRCWQQYITYSLNLLQLITENSRLIIVDWSVNSQSSLNNESVNADESLTLSTESCPRTGHYNKVLPWQQNGLQAAKSTYKVNIHL